jgi:peptidoglycan hydrolase CwlO-like protein
MKHGENQSPQDMTYTMNLGQIIAIIVSNLVLMVSAVWRLGASLQKVETQLQGMNDKMDIVNKYHDQEITSLKAQIGGFNETARDLQQRMTSVEVEIRMLTKQ